MPAQPTTATGGGATGGFSVTGCLLSLLLLVFAGFGIVGVVERGVARARERRAPELIRAVLASQEAAWNAGDLDGFMAGYWESDDLKFLSGGEITTGWRATHDRYRKRYKGEGKEMGRLKFDLLDVDVVGGDAAVVRGKWALTLSDGSRPHGLFTLLLRRVDGDWKIVSDHTSVAEKPPP